jgi:hypothetical protein
LPSIDPETLVMLYQALDAAFRQSILDPKTLTDAEHRRIREKLARGLLGAYDEGERDWNLLTEITVQAVAHTIKEITMAKDLKKGDKVEWDTSQGKTRGTVEREQTSRSHIKGHMVAASKDNPQYIVKSDKSGREAAHKPGELRKKP